MDSTPSTGTPIPDITDILGDDNALGSDDEGFLCQDINDDGTYEIGIDEDGDGVLDEDEVLGEDLNEDQTLTQDELDP
ncbi:MAG TPA: hypothetical protein VGR22_05445, partial [Thermomicrobiales bacterium]|nr:hypothetical protein [Thermomicrobiales bacterium]